MVKVYRIAPHPQRVIEIFERIDVDKRAFAIMLPKAKSLLFLLKGIEAFKANIIKQETLSLGAETAVGKYSLLYPQAKTEALIMGNRKQIERLIDKLSLQNYWDLKEIGQRLKDVLKEDNNFWRLRNQELGLEKPRIMGIINLTPDSFSGDGLLRKPHSLETIKREALKKARVMVREGASIIDIGGQSSRPGSCPVSIKEELRRVIPVLKYLKKNIRNPVSVDTSRSEVAKASIDEGVDIINDIRGLRDRKMRKVVAKSRVGVVIMHMKGSPRTMQRRPYYRELIPEIIDFLRERLEQVVGEGIERERVIFDPGIGFGKRFEDNFKILKYIKEFQILKRPILLGTSRKSFIGYILKKEPQERLYGSLATVSWAYTQGVRIFRVHDVGETRDTLKIMESIESSQ